MKRAGRTVLVQTFFFVIFEELICCDSPFVCELGKLMNLVSNLKMLQTTYSAGIARLFLFNVTIECSLEQDIRAVSTDRERGMVDNINHLYAIIKSISLGYHNMACMIHVLGLVHVVNLARNEAISVIRFYVSKICSVPKYLR